MMTVCGTEHNVKLKVVEFMSMFGTTRGLIHHSRIHDDYRTYTLSAFYLSPFTWSG
jgi:hypothetical protein